MDPRHRLNRPIIGERLHKSRRVEERAAERASIQPPQLEVPDHSRELLRKIRPSRKRVDPSPNAPQLIRLVRYPYVEDRGFFTRRKSSDFSLKRFARRPYREGFEAGMEAAQRSSHPRPTSVHVRPTPRQRLPLRAWLGEEE